MNFKIENRWLEGDVWKARIVTNGIVVILNFRHKPSDEEIEEELLKILFN